MGYTLNFAVVWSSMPRLLGGLLLGLELALASLAIGTLIGVVGGFVSVGASRAGWLLAATYVSMVRNTPILVIVLMLYFALPDLGVRLDKVPSFITALSLYSGAYLTEVFRAGLIAVPPGLIEAGKAIGLTRMGIALHVVSPVMLRNVLPALGSTFISLFKDTSIAAAIAVPELTFEARRINVESFRVVEAWTTASALYIATCFVIAAALRGLERRFPKF